MIRIPLDHDASKLTSELESRLADQLDRITQQIEQGEEPDVSELIADYPDMAETIRAYVRQIQLLHGTGDGSSNLLGLADSTGSKSTGSKSTGTGAANGTGDATGDDANNDELRIGDYRIEHEIGRGGMGIVYAARQISLDRPVALKILPFASSLDQVQITRFRNEARAAGQLHHPNIVPVFAVGCEDEIHFYAMQKIEGQSLELVFRLQKGEKPDTHPTPTWLDTSAEDAASAQAAGVMPEDKAETGTQAALSEKAFAENDWLSDSASGPNFDPDATVGLPAPSLSTESPKEIRRSGDAGVSEVGKLSGSGTHTTPGTAFEFAEPTGTKYHHQIATIGIQVAEALQYAHECGVIHRDIKPSNLMLDRQGKVWITDFGLARIQSGASMTQTGDVIGTFRYMSPEQASGDMKILDQRTDVYSLGITLYELLTLHEAFEGLDRREIMVAIEEKDPVLPRRLNPSIPIDLETIVLKAVSKKPEQRYASAQELADDLGRFLDGHPTLARRPTPTERLAKWAGRHRAAVRVAMILVVVAMIGFGITSVLIGRAHNQVVKINRDLQVARNKQEDTNQQLKLALKESKANMHRANANAQRAETLYHQARDVVDDLGTDYAKRLKGIDGAEELRKDLLTNTLKYYDQFIELSGNDPTLGSALGITYANIGEISDQLGHREKSIDSYRQAKQLLKKQVEKEPENPKHRSDLAVCLNNFGQLLDRDGKTGEARKQFADATGILDKLIETYPEKDKYQADLALVKHNLGLLNLRTGNLAEAQTDLETARDLQEPIVQRDPENPTYRSLLAATYDTLSRVYQVTDRKKAIQSCSQAIDIQEQLLNAHPQQRNLQNDLALSYHNLGVLQRQDGQDQEATDSYRKAIDLLTSLVKRAPAVVKYRFELAVSQNNLGRLLSDLDEPVEAGKAFDSARQILTGLVKAYPHDPNYLSSLGGTLNNLGMTFEQLGRHADAAQTYFEAIKYQHEANQAAPKVKRYKNFLSKQYVNYARTLRTLHHYKQAYDAIQLRKQLWKGHPEKLIGLAGEMAALATAMNRHFPDPTPEQSATYKKISDAAIETLYGALDAGVLTSRSLQSTAFDSLREDRRFHMITGKLDRE